MTLRAPFLFLGLVGFGLLAGGCSADAGGDEETEDELNLFSVNQGEYAFRYQFPAQELFKNEFSQAFPVSIERSGVRLDAVITPHAKIDMTSPIVEGKVTIGEHRFTHLPKILDAELKASSSYKAVLDVELDMRWSTTENKTVMREISREIEAKLSPGRAAMFLASRLGETNIPLTQSNGDPRKDLALKGHYDIVTTCSFEEIDGDLQGTFRTGVDGSVTARAIYNSEGVEKRRFARDPKKKFELDTSNVKLDPAPSFSFKNFRQHVKGSCSIQPVVVVQFENNVGVRLRVDARSAFDTQMKVSAAPGAAWELRASPELNIWGESDIRLPIIHATIDKETLLFSRKLGDVVVDVGADTAAN